MSNKQGVARGATTSSKQGAAMSNKECQTKNVEQKSQTTIVNY
jgi:hypothetical protein